MNLYQESQKYENIVVQSNLDGWYTKRMLMQDAIANGLKWNHRKILIHEVCFDIDIHLRGVSNEVCESISQALIKDNISHQVWDTSRSPHIHAFFKDMHLYPQETRKMIRFLIMKHYSNGYFGYIDKAKASEHHMIRDFNGQHEVTGKNKTLIYEFDGFNSDIVTPTYQTTHQTLLNPIPLHILAQLRVLCNAQANMPEIACIKPTEANLREMQDFITYCTENTLRADGKKTILSRNIAIACLLLGYDTNVRHRIYSRVDKNSTSKILNNLISWDKWLQKKSNLYFNWREIKLWYTKRVPKINLCNKAEGQPAW